MIKGKKRGNLVYSTKDSDRSGILSSTPLDDGYIRRAFAGTVTVTGKSYKYEPSREYREALSKYHKTPVRRVKLIN